ncbi:serine hydrolase domain-containing protein [Novosphingobium sp. ZN18A2]|uniref:serine hydrolase domain-containing protein n=1 Tax=Novosphingobium sp. ZN18A2 TaxID=3079861 RepID=UPI0030CC23B5
MDLGEEQPDISRRALLRGGIAAGAGLALLPRTSLAAAPTAAVAEANWPNVTALVDGYVDSGKLPEMIAALGWGQQPPMAIARGTLANNSETPVTIDSLYRIYSMTKPITGMATMILVDEGKLRLDQPLADILPRFAKMMVQATPDGSIEDVLPAKSPITIRELITHTSGLGYSIVQKGPIKQAYEDSGLVPGQVSKMKIPGLDDSTPVSSLADFTDTLAQMPLVYQPGTQWSYSVGLDLMGRVIEVVTGQPFDAFLKERIFAPTGMTSTFFKVPKADEPRLTTNYGVIGGVLVPIDPADNSIYLEKPPFPFGGAGLVSSPRDYDRFLMMLLGMGQIGGRRVMNEAAVKMGMSNLLPATANTKGTWIEGAGFGAGGRVGLGVDAGTYGWGGAAGTVAFVNTRVGNRASLFTQYMPDNSYPVSKQFPKAVIADLETMTGRKAAA